jgi:hydroxyacylglutathione hydrolase
VAFTADTLFAMGCGRVFEGTPAMMFASLEKLRALPDATRIYCGHEYTETNARFAVTVDPDNADLAARYADVKRLRAAGRMTLPTTIAEEKRTNPYFRVDAPPIRLLLQMENAPSVDVFAEIRRRKDNFK